ncbi:MAG: hypothetical protein M2R45_04524 [Verrucomicrobia subdivision 3 bacterium]|nr:hypothetical protein [Limisphaerales bacterium]MCS1416837.1 hypothetical protein [Limisphaerales bacterium]
MVLHQEFNVINFLLKGIAVTKEIGVIIELN